MTRPSVLLGVCLLGLALLPAAALAAAPRPGSPAVSAGAVTRLLAPVRVTAPAASASIGPVRAAAGAVIHGSITNPNGFAVLPARIHWMSPGGSPRTGSMLADQSGAYAFSAVPAAAGNGELWAVLEPDNGAWERGHYGMTWADGDDLTVDLRAGDVSVAIYRGGPWYAWKNAVLQVWTKPADGNGTCYTLSDIKSTDVEGDGFAAELPVEAGTGDGAVVYFWSNEGMEVPFAGEVQPGSSSVPSLTAWEESASRARVLEPLWSSGRPGKAVILNLAGFDTGCDQPDPRPVRLPGRRDLEEHHAHDHEGVRSKSQGHYPQHGQAWLLLLAGRRPHERDGSPQAPRPLPGRHPEAD